MILMFVYENFIVSYGKTMSVNLGHIITHFVNKEKCSREKILYQLIIDWNQVRWNEVVLTLGLRLP